MRFTPHKSYGTSTIHMANICMKSGSPLKHGFYSPRYIGWGLILFLGLGIISACEKANKPEKRTASMKPDTPTATGGTAVATQNRYSPQSDPMYPFKLITILQEDAIFGGMHCRLELDGEGWHKSNFDGMWNATLRRSFGPNEVSCLLESTDISTVQRVELEAEFYKVGYKEAEILMQFSQSAQILMHPSTPPFEFAEAVANKREWSSDQWKLTRIPYANGGFGLMLRRNK